MTTPWTIVIPVKGRAGAKSRLAATLDQAIAVAMDTVAVAVKVGHVIVVTEPLIAELFRSLGAITVSDPQNGLNAAVRAGIEHCGSGPVACLQGDLPGLNAEELQQTLTRAMAYPKAFVPDAQGVGTVLITALHKRNHRPAFGSRSAQAHRNAGYIELSVPKESVLRRDVDTRADLAALNGVVGPRTAIAFGLAPVSNAEC